MMPDERPSDLARRLAESIGRVAASSAAKSLASAAQQPSFGLLEGRVAAYRLSRRRLRAMGGLAAMCMIVGGVYLQGRRPHTPVDLTLTYRVGTGPSHEQGDLFESAAGADRTDVIFSDGTRMSMEPRARGRVADLDRRGARITLYQGRAHVDVRHRPNARWQFQAGPFEVRVHGTAFSIGWDAASAHFDLQMESGVVSVTGPTAGGEIVLRAGETLSMGLHQEGTAPAAPSGGVQPTPLARVGDSTTEPPQASMPPAIDSSPSDHSERALPRQADRPAAAARQWRAAVAAGHATAVLEDAERLGLGQVLEVADSEGLAALADAARFGGRGEIARRALLAIRRRFAESTRAAEAAFLLGRLDDTSAGGAASALSWYDQYLRDAPAGTYVSEALGRKMMDLEKTGRHQSAVAIASEYLRRFPTASYAHAASALVAPTASPVEPPGRTVPSPAP